MVTFLYVLAGWILFNIVVAVGMYFRPVRKPGPDDPNTAALRVLAKQPSDEAKLRTVTGHGNPLPAGFTKLLFFGFWLNDRVTSRAAAEREPT